MASLSPEFEGTKEDASDNLAKLDISDDAFERFKVSGQFLPVPNEAEDIEAIYPGFQFTDSLLNYEDDTFQELPELFTEESKELSDDDSTIEEDDDNAGGNVDDTGRAKQSYLKSGVKKIGRLTRKCCETVLYGFLMAVTQDIFLTGDVDFQRYKRSDQTDKILQQLNEHKKLWMNTTTYDAIRLKQVNELLAAIKKNSHSDILKAYYRAQHIHILNDDDKPQRIPVHIDRLQLGNDWVIHLNDAIKCINEATPGIDLCVVDTINESMIRIGVDDETKTQSAYTKYGGVVGGLWKNKKPFIHLGTEWNKKQMKGTSIHELMHALSINHEMQRYDKSLYLNVNTNNHNYKEKLINLKSLTRFDPFSVMMYPENTDMTRIKGDPIWELKTTEDRCQNLSELNKVALNMLFKPCKSDKYEPTISDATKMLYCNRFVMVDHNQVTKATTDYKCGPNNWANCPACRVIIKIKDKDKNEKPIPQLEKSLKLGKWQGLSGLFYCGKEDSAMEDGIKYANQRAICGPDTGIPCNECGSLLYKNYSIKLCDDIFMT